MNNMPRILPLVGVAIAGVFAVNALAGARDLPDLMSGARAFAEEAVKDGKAKPEPKPKAEAAKAAEGAGAEAAAKLPGPAVRPAAVCAPTAAELAKEAGLSPAELQVLQSLGARRGQLDKREEALDVQIALLAAAEAKLDAKIKTLNGLKGEVSGLLTQADTRKEAEVNRLVKVFEGMKAKDAAARMVVLDDSVRLPIAAKMKERSLSSIIAAMPPNEAKRLTESLAKRFDDARTAAEAAAAATQTAEAAPKPTQQAAKPPAKAAPPAKGA